MKVQFRGFVRDIYHSPARKTKGGADVAPVDYVSFIDKETGGDVKFSVPVGHGLEVGADGEFSFLVKGRAFNMNISYEVLQILGPKSK